jgi:mRNA interferase MazF
MVKLAAFRRGDVVLVNLDPTRGSEIRKTRPCLVISPDEMNAHLRTLIVAPMTTSGHAYPFRAECRFQGKAGYVVLDQVRPIDRDRIVQPLGRMTSQTMVLVLATMQEMFSA